MRWDVTLSVRFYALFGSNDHTSDSRLRANASRATTKKNERRQFNQKFVNRETMRKLQENERSGGKLATEGGDVLRVQTQPLLLQ